MTREPLHLGNRARVVEYAEHLLEEMPTCDIDAVRRHRAGGAPVTHGEGVLENARDARRKARAWMILLQRATAPEQMPDTSLMERLG